MSEKNPFCILNLCAAPARSQTPRSLTSQRLVRGFARLQEIQLVRNHRQDSRFGKPAEDRIVWRELLELELQNVDEQVEYMLAVAETARLAANIRGLTEEHHNGAPVADANRIPSPPIAVR
jgi:hypothetical protein